MEDNSQVDANEQPPLRLVLLGGSAGATEEFITVLAGLPQTAGFAVLVISHLDRTQQSQLDEVLKRHAAMPVERLTHMRKIEHDRVFVLPEDAVVTALDGHFRLSRRGAGIHMPIDLCLSSLAEDPDVQAAAVILSGAGSDGAAGVIDLKATGGFVIAQAPSSAAHEGMPTAAINTGLVDQVLTPQEIPGVLVQSFGKTAASGGDDHAESLATALALIQQKTGTNLGYIKDVNLKRRFLRRVLLQKDRDIKAYLQFLRTDPQEANALRDDVLIGVTAFFRDAEFVNVLRLTVIPKLIELRHDPIRIWVTACSTGEEVYTIAMLVKEALDIEGLERKVQIFGTDINEASIEKARAARYSAAAVDNVPENFREKYFIGSAGGYLIRKEIRSMCVFSCHNLLTHAPFSGMALVSCRNLLIYLRKESQQHVMDVLNYAVRPDGFVVLGRAEAAHVGDGFEHAGAPHLYRRLPHGKRQRRTLPGEGFPLTSQGTESAARARLPTNPIDVAADRTAIDRYAPPGFVVNDAGDVVQFRGDVGAFVAPATGEATLSLSRLLQPELNLPVRTALLEAKQSATPVRRERVPLGDQRFALEALPLALEGDARHFLLTLQHQPAEEDLAPAIANARETSRGRESELERTVAALSDELEMVKGQLKTMMTEFESANEELRTSNEEILSANEELQSANEELQSAKQELESANQELNSLNEEMKSQNDQLAVANDDMSNLVEGIPLPVVLLDRLLRLRHFSPQAAALFGLQAESFGQPMPTLNSRFAMADIERMVQTAVQGLTAVEREYKDANGRWWLVNVRAYRTVDDRIDGAVIAFQDVDSLKSALAQAQAAREEAERANAAKDDFLALVSHELRAPLNVISGWASVLERTLDRAGRDDAVNTTPDVDRKKAVATILRQCRAQAQLIDDLLDISRISSGRFALETRAVELGACVGMVFEGLQPAAAVKGVALVGSGFQSGHVVNGDARRLRQIIANLIENAIKFTPAGGRIEVAVSRAGPFVELSVADNGIGVSTDLLPRLFEKFTQSDIGRTREYGGLGLGLSIVRHLVTAHGGSVSALSDGEGRGARFIVRLPSVEVAAREPLPLTVPPQVTPELGLSILLVDDDRDGREAMQELLSYTGAAVLAAASVDEALHHLEARRFDAIVSDIAMPGRDGYELMRITRERERRSGQPRVYAVALTGFASLHDRDAAIAAGFDDHVAKPVDADALTQKLAIALGRKDFGRS
jgi:two-component system, chemotaxis family, CheB/CheR fusion protein